MGMQYIAHRQRRLSSRRQLPQPLNSQAGQLPNRSTPQSVHVPGASLDGPAVCRPPRRSPGTGLGPLPSSVLVVADVDHAVNRTVRSVRPHAVPKGPASWPSLLVSPIRSRCRPCCRRAPCGPSPQGVTLATSSTVVPERRPMRPTTRCCRVADRRSTVVTSRPPDRHPSTHFARPALLITATVRLARQSCIAHRDQLISTTIYPR